jgi:NNP family nitrate/nitrite transporter-like MFS transporter
VAGVLGPGERGDLGQGLAWKTLWVTTFCLTLAFVAWFLPSAIIPKLNALGYEFTKSQLYWMAAMPGLAAVCSGSCGWCCRRSWAPARWSR